MEHRALALAYRPQTFGDVAGQRHVTDVLAKAVEHERVAHAYLFSGPRGTGKTTTARILAKTLNCPNRKGVEPCNKCDTCNDITNGVSLDVVEIDGASNRGIADIQQLREKVRFAATGGGWKVYIVDEVHQLSADAFAALLKTLEEPPPKVCFIFATTDPLKLPDTIRSRCQRYEMARVSVRVIADRLIEIARLETKAGRKIELDEAAALLIARKAEGGLRDAVSALDQVVSTGRTKVDEATVTEVLGLVSRETFFDLAEPILGRDPAKTLAQLHQAYRAGFDPKDLADGLLEHLRNVLVLKVDPAARDLLAATPEECTRYVAQGEGWSSADVLRQVRIVTDAIGMMRESSQPLLHFEAAALELAHMEPGRTLAAILAELERIEGGGGGGARPAASPGSAAAGPAGRPGPWHAARVGHESRRARSFLRGAVARAGRASGRGSAGRARGAASHRSGRADGVRLPGCRGRRARRPRRVVRRRRPRRPRPSPAPDLPLDPDFDAASAWPAVIEAVKARNRVLGHCVADVRVLGAHEGTLVLEIDAAQRAMLEHRDNRAVLLGACASAYGRRLDYRVVVAPTAAPASGPPDDDAPPPDAPPPGFEGASPGPRAAASASRAAASAAPSRPAAGAAAGAANGGAKRKRPDDLSPGAKSAMVWLEGEIVGPDRPTP